MKSLIVITLSSLVLLLACQSNNSRLPTNTDSLTTLLNRIQFESEIKVATYEECYRKTNEHYNAFYNLKHDETRLINYSAEQLDNLLVTSFNSRLNILNQLKNLKGASTDSQKCFNSIRDLTRALRYFEDYIVEQQHSSTNSDMEIEYTTLEGVGSYFLVNPKFTFTGSKDLRSGDIIISRGNAYTSAAIARIGSVDAQFSHVTSVYRDENGELHTTEAHIEIGSVVAPWKVHVEQGNTREVVFRYKDAKVAHEAAKYIYERVRKYSNSNRNNINYDFSMDYKDHKDLFCSEVVSSGFKQVTNSKVDIPRYKTKFNPKLVNFLQNIGMKVDKNSIHDFDTFGPGDLEFDNRFELVAEWRRPNKLRNIRMKDAVLTMMYKWMTTKGYKLRQGIKIPLRARLAWFLRRVPLAKKKLIEKFPLNMKPKLLGTFLILDEVGDVLLNQIEEKQKTVDYPLSFKEIYALLEDFRQKDSKLKRRKSKLHKVFRP